MSYDVMTWVNIIYYYDYTSSTLHTMILQYNNYDNIIYCLYNIKKLTSKFTISNVSQKNTLFRTNKPTSIRILHQRDCLIRCWRATCTLVNISKADRATTTWSSVGKTLLSRRVIHQKEDILSQSADGPAQKKSSLKFPLWLFYDSIKKSTTKSRETGIEIELENLKK